MNRPNLVTTKVASRMLCVPAATLTFWRFAGKGPRFIRMCRNVRYRVSDLEEFAGGPLDVPEETSAPAVADTQNK